MAFVVVAVLVGGLVPQVAATAQAAPPLALESQRYKSVGGTRATGTRSGPDPAEAAASKVRPAPAWPTPGMADVTVPASVVGGSTSDTVRAGSLPVRVGPAVGAGQARVAGAAPKAARVQVLSQAQARAAGVAGLLLRVGRTDEAAAAGPLNVQVDYSSFRYAYGADWASRLRLLRLPECGLTGKGGPGCVPVELVSRNDTRSATVSADVLAVPVTASSSGTLVALAAGPSGGAGDYAASSLAPSSTWGHGGGTGGFSWSYPMRVPPGVGGPAPSVGLSYASQSVDGRHAATNNQPGQIGEGFAYEPGFIERRYKACAEDMGGNANNTTKTGDLCWATDNAILSLGGSSIELLQDGSGRWHPRREDGSKIERLNHTFDNGDNDGEYWKVTTADGTQYWFGRHRLPGWSAGRPTTDSVLSVPVFGNNPNEPCHASTFAASRCGGKNQARRWNLDYVQDVHGNTMSLWWARETNHYALNIDTTTPVGYHRGSHLTRIDYGSDNRDDNEYAAASPYVENTPGRVEFSYGNRCLSTSNCATKNETTWPDTPWDQECTASTNPCLNAAPTFWSANRLSVVTTKVWKAATSSYQNVDSWTLRHSFPDPGDGTRAGLWLEGITHRGLNGSTVTLPEVTFGGIQMSNRVDAAGSDWALAMNWWRVNKIVTEMAGEIHVSYSGRECVAGSNLPAAVDNNRMRCFPVRWTPPAYTDPLTDYFHKYVVTQVQQIDHTGGAHRLLTRYEYKNPSNLPLWHYDDDDGLVPEDRKSWGQWRGYPSVVTKVGEGAEETKTETLYFRGMHGDKLDGGGTRTVTVQGLEGAAVTDHEHFAGMPREQITWLGSSVLSAAVSDPWRSDPPTATRSGTPAVEARYARTQTVQTRTALDGGAWRRATTKTTYDSYGMATKVDDLGDDATAVDDRCTATEYVRNTAGSNWLLTPVKRVHGWADDCNTAPTAGAQVTGDTLFTLDNLAYGATPSKGSITTIQTVKDWNGGNRLYQTVGTSKYDVYGRVTETTDIAGEKTTTTYTPATGGPVTQAVTTNPLAWTQTVELDPAWGVPVKTTDPNLRVTEIAYDAIGRTTGVWLPGRAKATFPNDPSTGYAYTPYVQVGSTTTPWAITTRTLNALGGYHTSYELIDALGRPRQTQQPAYGGGRIITDSFYDSAGRVYKSNAAYYNSGTAETVLYLGYDADMPSQSRTLFDAAGRPTHSILLASPAGIQIEKWRTSTTYHGDHTTITPPAGGIATTVWADARGNTTKLWQHHGPTPTGGYDETRYTYHPAGQLATVIDPSGNTWSYEYDIQGRQKVVSDPDAGTATMTYNNYGELETISDSRPNVVDLAYTYDRLGRPTSVREGSITGPIRAEWVYDTPAKGLLKSASRWISGNEYKTETVTVDAQYRPTQTRTTIPGVEGNLAGTYTFRATYRADGSPNTITLPAAGGLSAETLTYGYDSAHAVPERLATNYAGASHYVVEAVYTNLFEANLTTRATALTGAPSVQTGQYYDEGTGRIKRRPIIKNNYVSNASYEYDPAGNITKIDDNAVTPETQCFTYDHQRRLTQAWTPATADCNATPTATGLGGPAPYWHSWDFGTATDPDGRIGSQLSYTEHATPTGDVTTTYTYDGNGANQPHTLTSYSRQDNNGTTTGTYTYDTAGNTLTRPGPNGQQTLTWDPEGHLTTLNDTAGTNAYVYDADGNRLISKDPTGATLHLPGMELRLANSAGQVTATRYYTFNGETIAQRTPTALTWLAADHQGTNQVAITADTNQTVTWRRQTPYGKPRGTATTWPNKLGFVGGYQDPTGLTHLGAREYDPTTGRFISVDPILNPGNPQHLHPYTYAGNNPTTGSDPSGLIQPEYNDPEMNPCAYEAWGYGCKNSLEKKRPKEAPAVNSKNVHEGLDYCGLIPVVGVVCDAANGIYYLSEKDYTGAAVSAVSFIPGVDLACKFKNFCRGLAEAGVSRVKSLVGKSVKSDNAGSVAASTDDIAEIAREKAERRATGNTTKQTAPKPTTPPAPTKKGGGGPGPNPGKSACKHSFDPDTPVLMADGTNKPIKDVAEGDKVRAHNPETRTTTNERVTDLHINADTELTDLTIRTETGQLTTLETTQHHPFWSETRQAWIDAAELRPHEVLRTAHGQASVDAVHNYRGAQTMRDLTVKTVHTYYVVVGETPVLVHNCSPELKAYADSLDQRSLTIDVVSRLTTMDNPTGYFSHNMNRGIEDVDYDAYTAIQNAGGHHLGCAEIGCISDAFEAGDPMTNAVIESVHFAPGTPYHLTPVAPCPAACESLLPRLGIRTSLGS
ncbi:type IV secretion protein Rhs [Phytohabitans aurantiacus]|uniref:Type IV secretion protein Rhs n=2 Tax=Phytohabitans aurantiacus TaxID=3016789 RepID=A0ABQ5QZK3_9ACTN|nr:type IV secretion protein Rhs [Phytohabitans aurantiacus]